MPPPPTVTVNLDVYYPSTYASRVNERHAADVSGVRHPGWVTPESRVVTTYDTTGQLVSSVVWGSIVITGKPEKNLCWIMLWVIGVGSVITSSEVYEYVTSIFPNIVIGATYGKAIVY